MFYGDGYYDLMEGNRRVNRQCWDAKYAKHANAERKKHGIPSRWVWLGYAHWANRKWCRVF